MLNDKHLEELSLKAYLEKLEKLEDSDGKFQTIKKVKRKLSLLEVPMVINNEFLKDYSISNLKILIEECYSQMKGWKNSDGSMEPEGYILNDKLEILHEYFNEKVENCLCRIKTRDD